MTAKPKSELMARLRKERRELGLVRLEVWVKPENVDAVKAFVDKLKAS